ncbi:TolC family outer membrane protein (plasmid) [Sulfitobacter sp. OXR-159]|uniref:TolC family outer membrane protein n=1 Tax=Sulfitobacter sp. OXR-159 TaxID=3100174 RepID=UPI002AC8E8D3|nr:TolC family outer membrane protein [Sulfitobacter sp. OXR-159]WPZ31647.1 TolC family outer membrane protein [Sulfitobacter sp. OXR-159]
MPLTLALLLPRPALTETLADALVGAYEHSGLLDQNRALLRAADEDVASAQAALKPVLRWAGGLTQNFGSTRASSRVSSQSTESLTASINLIGELLLYDFGASQYRIEATKETVLATRQTLLDLEQRVLLRTVAAYLGVVEASDVVALRNNNLRLLTQELRAARDRFDVGEVTNTDVALAEAQLAEARSGLAGAQGALLRAVEEYQNVVGRKPSNLSTPSRLPNVGGNLEGAKALAVRTHPSVLAAQHQVAAARLAVSSNEAAMSPRVTLQGSYGLSETFDSKRYNRSGSVGVQAGQTIYQGGGALSSAVRRAKAQEDAQRANLHVVSREVAQEVGNAYASLTSARAQLESSDRQIRAARAAFEGVREEADLGARTTVDVLDAEQVLLDAESTRASARANLYIAAYAVLAATGQLTARDLQLPVQLYDVTAYYNLVKDGPAKYSKQGQALDRVLRALQKD